MSDDNTPQDAPAPPAPLPFTPRRRRAPRIIREENDRPVTGVDDFSYFAFSPPDRLAMLKKKIEEREKVHFDLTMLIEGLDGNPEPGDHNDSAAAGACQCGRCELRRADSMLKQNAYAIRKLRALYTRLA